MNPFQSADKFLFLYIFPPFHQKAARADEIYRCMVIFIFSARTHLITIKLIIIPNDPFAFFINWHNEAKNKWNEIKLN